ncbi:MAG: F0F1 ATP synthase subunit alpha, partial [Ignavibacteriae bacterium]|nr:F0F1 ATP synthase subunit alpha [Ignavibacteriota bacterium]
ISVKDIKRFQSEMLEFIEVNNKNIFEEIRTKKQISDELNATIKKTITDFQSKFKKSE